MVRTTDNSICVGGQFYLAMFIRISRFSVCFVCFALLRKSFNILLALEDVRMNGNVYISAFAYRVLHTQHAQIWILSLISGERYYRFDFARFLCEMVFQLLSCCWCGGWWWWWFGFAVSATGEIARYEMRAHRIAAISRFFQFFFHIRIKAIRCAASYTVK